MQPEEPKDEEKVSDQLKKLRKSKNPNFSVLEKGKEEEKKSGMLKRRSNVVVVRKHVLIKYLKSLSLPLMGKRMR
jgi:hypothetical protein